MAVHAIWDMHGDDVPVRIVPRCIQHAIKVCPERAAKNVARIEGKIRSIMLNHGMYERSLKVSRMKKAQTTSDILA